MKFKVLISSYACAPNLGSEKGVGWNWILSLSKDCELFVISEGEFRAEVETALRELGLTEVVHFYWNPIGGTNESKSRTIRQMCWNQGDWRFYYYYAQWQKRTLQLAREIVREHRIDIIHQLNMVGFREPGMLYRINDERLAQGRSRIPLVWGPIAGFGHVPLPYVWGGGLRFALFYSIKNALNIFQLKFQPRVRKMLHAADRLIAATPDMQSGILRYHGLESELIPETGCNDRIASQYEKRTVPSARFRLLWVGRFLYTKQLDIALRTMTYLKDLPGIELHIVGQGTTPELTSQMHRRAEALGVADFCHWHGQITNDQVQQLMRESNLFFFTSVFEATSTVVLESISNQLPVLCFDLCGFGPIITDKIGRKIPCQDAEQSSKNFAIHIRALYHERSLLAAMAANCSASQESLCWQRKGERILGIYEEIGHSGE